MVNAATQAAVRASISTPVRSLARVVAVIDTRSWPTPNSMSTEVRFNPWHSGMSSGVFLAAITPAILAVFNTSPLGNAALRNSPIVSEDMRTTAPATAMRRTTSFSPTSTILAAPSLSRCENFMSKPPFFAFQLLSTRPVGRLSARRPASPDGLSAFQLARSQALADKRRRQPGRADLFFSAEWGEIEPPRPHLRSQTGFEDRPGHQAHAFLVRRGEVILSPPCCGGGGVLTPPPRRGVPR